MERHASTEGFAFAVLAVGTSPVALVVAVIVVVAADFVVFGFS